MKIFHPHLLPLATLILRISVVLILLLVIDVYFYQGLKQFFSVQRRKWVAIVYWSVTWLFLLALILTFLFLGKSHGSNSRFLQLMFATFVLIYIPKIVVDSFLVMEDFYRFTRRWRYRRPRTQSGDPPTPHTAVDHADTSTVLKAATAAAPQPLENPQLLLPRRRFITLTGMAVAGIPFVGILDGVVRGVFNYRVHQADLHFPHLPPAFDGLRVVQISDLHSGSLFDPEAVNGGFDLIRDLEADLILFTGDLVNNLTDEVKPLFDIYRRLEAPLGVWSILGNHDYGNYSNWPNAEAKELERAHMREMHERLGWRLMRNESVRLTRQGQEIALLGVENWGTPPFPQYGDLNQALQGIDPGMFKILMSHDPTHWDEVVLAHDEPIDLTLSGHTHGMQFGVELGDIRWSPVSLRYPRWAGLYAEGSRYLYVNRGFGFIGFPGRVGIYPEITLLTLRRGQA